MVWSERRKIYYMMTTKLGLREGSSSTTSSLIWIYAVCLDLLVRKIVHAQCICFLCTNYRGIQFQQFCFQMFRFLLDPNSTFRFEISGGATE